MAIRPQDTSKTSKSTDKALQSKRIETTAANIPADPLTDKVNKAVADAAKKAKLAEVSSSYDVPADSVAHQIAAEEALQQVAASEETLELAQNSSGGGAAAATTTTDAAAGGGVLGGASAGEIAGGFLSTTAGVVTTVAVGVGVAVAASGGNNDTPIVNQSITGTAGNDTLAGGLGSDTINALAGADSITGGGGADSIIAGAGNDTIVGFDGPDTVDGGADTDTLVLSATSTELNSATDAQLANVEAISLSTATAAVSLNLSKQTEAAGFVVTGSTFADSIIGSAGEDSIVGAQNDALLDGGAGTDTLQVGANFTNISDTQINAIEVVGLTATGLSLDLGKQTEGLTINGFATGASTIIGGAGADSITGGSGGDSITGGAGADTLLGGAGNDTIVGAQDDALIDGGTDANTLQVGANFTSTSDNQIQNIQNVSLTATGLTVVLGNQTEALNITGFAAGASTITGGSGSDTITGGSGNDVLTGGSGTDTINAGTGVDTVNIDANGVGPIDADRIDLGGDKGDNIVFSNVDKANEILVGFVSTNVGNGSSTGVVAINQAISAVDANNGVDLDSGVYAGINNTNVSLTGASFHVVGLDKDGVAVAGQDRGVFGAVHLLSGGDDTFTAGNTNEYVNAGSGNDNVTGGSGNDFLVGGAGNDSLTGGAGSDTFIGGGGTDSILGGTGDDVVVASMTNAAGTSVGFDNGDTADLGTELGDEVVITNATVNQQVLVSFISGEVGNGSTNSSVNTSQLAVNLQLRDVTDPLNPVDVGGVARIDDEGVTLTGAKFNVVGLDKTTGLLDPAQDRGVFDVVALGTQGGDAISPGTPGGTENYYVNAGQGNDTITGGDLNDFIVGGAGEDSISSGLGNDTIIGDNDDVLIDGGKDFDALRLAGNFTNASDAQVVNIEAVSLTATGLTLDLGLQTEDLIINGFAAGASTITGGSGNDSITGGSGNDSITGGSGADTINAGAGVDTVNVDANGAGPIDADRINLGGDAGDTVNFSNLDGGQELLVGFVSANVGNGSSTGVVVINQATSAANANNGVDLDNGVYAAINNTNVSLTGGTFHVVGVDANGVAQAGQDRGVFGAVHLLSGGDDTFTAGDTNEYVNAGSGNDSITGGSGNDFLVGGAGADTLSGGAGNDTFIGGGGADSITGGTGVDRAILDVSASIIDADRIDLGGNAGDTVAFTNLAGGRELLVGFVSANVGDGSSSGVVVINQATSGANANNGVDLDSGVYAGINNTNVSLTGGTFHVVGLDKDGVAVAGQDRGVFGAVHLLSSGDDTFTAGNNNEYVNAGSGNDSITGGNGNDFLVGGAGNDTLSGGSGADTILAGAGDDTVSIDLSTDGADSITLGAGQDTLNLTASGGGSDQIRVTLDLDNVANGTDNSVSLQAEDGKDVLTGSVSTVEDETMVIVATGGDKLDVRSTAGGVVGVFDTFVIGDATANTLSGSAGDDLFYSGAGDDVLSGGNGNDLFNGGAGNDSYTGGAGNDTFVVSAGTDTVTDLDQSDIFSVGFGATLNATTTSSFVATSSSSNSGAVTITLQGAATVVDLTAASGSKGYTLTSETADVTLTGSRRADTISGGAGNDLISGGNGNDSIIGGLGDDEIDGGAGVDFIIGGLGNDTIDGGLGADTIIVDSGSDTVNGLESADILTVVSGASATIRLEDTLATTYVANTDTTNDGTVTIEFQVATNITSVDLSQAGGSKGFEVSAGGISTAISITGSAQSDSISAGAGADTLLGGEGNDSLQGGEGVDNYTGGDGADLFQFFLAATDLDTAAGVATVTDVVLDFNSASGDRVEGMFGAATSTNYLEAAGAAVDLATLLGDADAALDGTVKYYLGETGGKAYLVTDDDGTGITHVIQLDNVTLATFQQSDIVA